MRRMLHGAAVAGERPVNTLRYCFADDALTGLKAGLWGGSGAQGSFLLPTRSPLAPYIIERKERYGSESLKFLWKNGRSGEDRLRPVPGERGVYQYFAPFLRRPPNMVVIGEERYGEMTPPGSVGAFLEEFATTPAQ